MQFDGLRKLPVQLACQVCEPAEGAKCNHPGKIPSTRVTGVPVTIQSTLCISVSLEVMT